MKTEELIAALAADRELATPPSRLAARLMPIAVAVAVVLCAGAIGLRRDLVEVATDPRFVFKVVVSLCAAIPAAMLMLRIATPLPRPGRWPVALWIAPLVLLAGVCVELLLLPQARWAGAAIGHNSLWCLTMVPTLAIVPLATCLYCLRQAAPARPVVAGAVAGLASGAIAASIYALHCTDDSPLFVAIWYTAGVAFVTGVGAWAAWRLARW